MCSEYVKRLGKEDKPRPVKKGNTVGQFLPQAGKNRSKRGRVFIDLFLGKGKVGEGLLRKKTGRRGRGIFGVINS